MTVKCVFRIVISIVNCCASQISSNKIAWKILKHSGKTTFFYFLV